MPPARRPTASIFLCLEELALERPPLRHVAGVDHYPPHDGILQERATEGFEDAVAAVLVSEPQLEEPTALARRDPLGEHPQRSPGIVGVHQVEQLPPDELFWDIAQKREHRGARVADRALSVEHRDDIHRLLDQRLEVFLSLAQLLLHALRSALALERALHRRAEAGQPILEDVVRGARLHVLHGGFLVERARQKNERRTRRELPRQWQRRSAAELRELVVGNDDVGVEFAQGVLEVDTRHRTPRREIEPRFAELHVHQLSVRVAVLEQEDADRHRGSVPGARRRRSR